MSYCLWVPCVIIVLNTILIQKASKLLHDPSITTTLLPVHTFINQCQKMKTQSALYVYNNKQKRNPV